MKTTELVRKQISENPILLYMKGTPQFPMCGFSGSVVTILKKYNHEYSFVNVLEHERIMQALPEVSDWPTFPQLFINGELIGGADIVGQLDKSGELNPLLESAQVSVGS